MVDKFFPGTIEKLESKNPVLRQVQRLGQKSSLQSLTGTDSFNKIHDNLQHKNYDKALLGLGDNIAKQVINDHVKPENREFAQNMRRFGVDAIGHGLRQLKKDRIQENYRDKPQAEGEGVREKKKEGFWGRVWNGVKSVGKGIWNFVKAPFKKLVNHYVPGGDVLVDVGEDVVKAFNE